MLVTTTVDPQPHTLGRAQQLADELQSGVVDRSNRTLAQLMELSGESELLIVGDKELRYKEMSGTTLFFHPSMSMIRVKRLLAGEADIMLKAARVEPGDRIIDCTMGLASDAIVFSYAAGESGRVEAVESERIPYILAREGLRTYECSLVVLERAMRRVVPLYADHLDYLRLQPDQSADVVYFDPMFRHSAAGSAIEPLRGMANSAALRSEAVEQAIRVARKTVVMKEHNRSGEFARLGFRPIYSASAKMTYGVMDCEGIGSRR